MQTIWDRDIITCAFLKTYSKKMNSHFRWYDPLLSSNDYGKNDLSKLNASWYALSLLPITSLS